MYCTEYHLERSLDESNVWLLMLNQPPDVLVAAIVVAEWTEGEDAYGKSLQLESKPSTPRHAMSYHYSKMKHGIDFSFALSITESS